MSEHQHDVADQVDEAVDGDRSGADHRSSAASAQAHAGVPAAQAGAGTPGAPRPTSAAVATGIDMLDELGVATLAAHPDVYQRIHAQLQGALADVDND